MHRSMTSNTPSTALAASFSKPGAVRKFLDKIILVHGELLRRFRSSPADFRAAALAPSQKPWKTGDFQRKRARIGRSRAPDAQITVSASQRSPRRRPRWPLRRHDFRLAPVDRPPAGATAPPSALPRPSPPARFRDRTFTLSGISARSFSFSCGMITVLIPARRAASSFSFSPPIGSTRPRNVTSPVIATSRRTGMPVSTEMIDVPSPRRPTDRPWASRLPARAHGCRSCRTSAA